MESRGEVLDEVVQSYISSKTEKKVKHTKNNESDSEEEDFCIYQITQKEGSKDAEQKVDDDLFYYNKNEKNFKVFNPRTK